MNSLFLLFLMIFLHIIDDFLLQNCLAKLKQKKYWEENCPDKLYKSDYKMALFAHSFEWTFMINLPLLYINRFDLSNKCTFFFYASFIVNILIHYTVDDLKANKFKINLITDQILHICQIIFLWVIYINLF